MLLTSDRSYRAKSLHLKISKLLPIETSTQVKLPLGIAQTPETVL